MFVSISASTAVRLARRQAYLLADRTLNLPTAFHGAAHSQYSTLPGDVEPPVSISEQELRIFNKLKSELRPTKLEVQDISGGCGSMYGLDIVSPEFKGLTLIKQHQLVNRILSEEIKDWHGIQLKTKAT